MKRLAHLLIRLYPNAWRARYGEEFATLIEDTPPRPSMIFDLCKGAIRMQVGAGNLPRLALLMSLAGLAAGFAASWLVTPIYTSRAELQITDTIIRVGGETATDAALSEEQKFVFSRTSLYSIVRDPRLDLYHREQTNEPLEDVIERMHTRDIRIRAIEAGRRPEAHATAFSIEFQYSDPHKAQKVVQALILRFMNANRQQQRAGRAVALVVLDPPSLPERAVSPKRILFAGGGFAGGFFVALLIALLRRPGPPQQPQLAAN